MRAHVQQIALAAKGFLSLAEGMRLFELARESARLGPCVEIGSYCGKSALFLGEGCRVAGGHALFSVDHHRGNEEQQRGGPYFDESLEDAVLGRSNTLPHFVRNVEIAGLQEWIIPVVGDSTVVARNWPGAAFGLVFLDGGHSDADVSGDYGAWAGLVAGRGYLCFHDIYPDPADGGQAPYRVFERARTAPGWRYVGLYGSLGVLQRV